MTIDYPEGLMPLRYRMGLSVVGQKPELVDEVVENEAHTPVKRMSIFIIAINKVVQF